jgi:hypothetical protein
VRLDAVLLEPRVDAELVRDVLEDLLQEDAQLLARLVDDPPHAWGLLEAAGRAHPVEWLVGPIVGVDRHRAVRLDHE